MNTTTASPATVGPIPFSTSVQVERRKSVDTRAARWLLLSVACMALVAALIPLVRPDDVTQDFTNYLRTVALGVTFLLPVVSILTITAEWSQRIVLTTFTQQPRRERVLAAKVIAGLELALAGAFVGVAVAATCLQVSSALGRDVSWHIATGAVAGYVLFVLINSLMGMAFGALFHNTAVAIVVFLGLPTLMTLIALPLDSAGDWVDPTTTFGWILRGEWAGHGSQIATSLAIWIAVPMAAGLARTLRREVQ